MDVLLKGATQTSGSTAGKKGKIGFWKQKKFASLLEMTRLNKEKIADAAKATATARTEKAGRTLSVEERLLLMRKLLEHTKNTAAQGEEPGTHKLVGSRGVSLSDLLSKLEEWVNAEDSGKGAKLKLKDVLSKLGDSEEAGEKELESLEMALQLLAVNLSTDGAVPRGWEKVIKAMGNSGEGVVNHRSAKNGKKSSGNKGVPLGQVGSKNTAGKGIDLARLLKGMDQGLKKAEHGTITEEGLLRVALNGPNRRTRSTLSTQVSQQAPPFNPNGIEKDPTRPTLKSRLEVLQGGVPQVRPVSPGAQQPTNSLELLELKYGWEPVAKAAKRTDAPTGIIETATGLKESAILGEQQNAEMGKKRGDHKDGPFKKSGKGSVKQTQLETTLAGASQAKDTAKAEVLPGRPGVNQSNADLSLEQSLESRDTTIAGKSSRTESFLKQVVNESSQQTPRGESGAEASATTRTQQTSATSKVPTPPPRPPQPMFTQVEQALKQAYILRPKSVTVRINPEELGEVRVHVAMEKDHIHAKIQAESQKVTAILKEHQAELENRLREQGVDIDQLEIKDQRRDEQKQERREQSAGMGFGQHGDPTGSRQHGTSRGSGSRRDEVGEAEAVEEPAERVVERPVQDLVAGRPFSFTV